MSISEVLAKNERLDKITQEEKKGIDEYIENVNGAIKTIEYHISGYIASGDLLDEIKEMLLNDVEKLRADVRRLSNLSEELQIRINGYERYLKILSKAIR